jgi:hypothetical protein
VQGYEWKLIQGAEGVIRRYRPVILCEIAPATIEAAGDDYRPLLSFLTGLSYDIALLGGPNEDVEPISEEGVVELLTTTHADSLFVPRDHD